MHWSINENFLGISVIQAEKCIQEFHWEIAAAKFHYTSMLFAQFKFNDPTIILVWTKKLSFWLGTITLFCDLLPTKITIEKMHRFCLQISQGTIATLSKTIDTVFKHQMIDDSDPWSITICHTTSTTIHTEKKGFLHKVHKLSWFVFQTWLKTYLIF